MVGAFNGIQGARRLYSVWEWRLSIDQRRGQEVANVAAILADYRAARYRAYCWRRERSVATKLLLALGLAGLTGMLAQVRIVLPFTDVPITGQTFPALLAGAMLGGVFGGLSQVMYVAIGAAGVPWFTGMTGGPSVLLGPTAGYLAGFVLVAFMVGEVSERWAGARSFGPQLFLMACGSAFILFCGWLNLAFLLGRGPTTAFLTGVAPFIAGDLVKAFAAAGIGTALLPKTPSADSRQAERTAGRMDTSRGDSTTSSSAGQCPS
jgi:biotin transport system substrate-specific component